MKIKKIEEAPKEKKESRAPTKRIARKEPIKHKRVDGGARVDFFVSINEEISSAVREWTKENKLNLNTAAEILFSEALKGYGILK